MKKGKHVNSKADTREIVKLQEYQEPEASFVYDDEEEASREQQKRTVPKAVYRVGVVLLVVILGLSIWINRDNLSPEKIWAWVQEQVMGQGTGDGFPVSFPGSNVPGANFTETRGKAVILSDTAFTMVDSTGKQALSLRHSFNEPTMSRAGDCFLLYNAGSTGYVLQSGTKTLLNTKSDRDIICGGVAPNGCFALGVQGSEGATELQVYEKDGTLKYVYYFAQDYITSVALNYDGTFGMVGTVHSDKGELISKITVLDFSKPDSAVADYETSGALFLGMSWSENGTLYAVGDTAIVTAHSADYQFREYSYEGRELTAFATDANRAFVSVSAYEHAGPSTMLVFNGDREYAKIEAEERIISISVAGSVVGTLQEDSVVVYEYGGGQERGRASAGADARSIALSGERNAYVMGVNEVRMVEIE